jgi:hypothetical protein
VGRRYSVKEVPMSKDDPLAVIRWGAAAGLATCVVYPLMIFVPLPALPTVLLASSMGPLLGIASWGLREFLNLEKRRRASDLAALSNALAGALFSAMILVQLAAGRRNEHPGTDAVSIWLGLDVAWDVYIGLGTLLFAVCALRHPRLGVIVGVAGVAIAAGLLALNLYTFPTPPAEAGLVDLGPAVGLWYLVVTVMLLWSLRWARAIIARDAAARPDTR